MKLRTSLCLGAGLVAMTCMSCMSPGQYRVYRVANGALEQSAGCYPAPPGQDVTGDSSSFRTGQTFAIYAADSDTFFLDLEMTSLVGSKDGTDFSFEGESVDVMSLGDSTLTVTTVMSVSAEIEGKKISGTSTLDVAQSCTAGMSCPDPASSQCITTVSFQGAEVKDAELEHAI